MKVDTGKGYRLEEMRPGLMLIALVALAFILRIPNLEVTGFWMDELFSAAGGDPSKSFEELIEYCKKDQPPFFFLLLHGWFKVFPFNDFFGRFFVLLTGCAGVIVMYFLGRTIRSERVGLIAAFITVINYFHIDMSRQLRFYPLVFLLSALSFLFFYSIFKKQRNVDFVGYVLATSALLNSHYFGIVVFVSQFILLIIVCISEKISDVKFIAKAVGAGVVTALSFAHWLPVVFSDLGISEFHIPPLAWYFPVQYWWVYFRDPIAAVACAILIIVGLTKFYNQYRVTRKIELTAVVLIGWIALCFLIPVVYSLVKMPMLEYKYSIITLPAFFILIAIGAEQLNKRVTTIGAIVLFAGYLATAFYFRPIYFRKSVEEWREVALHIKATDGKDQFVFSNYSWYLQYYFNQYGMQSPPFPQRYGDFSALVNQAARICVVVQTRYPDTGLSIDQQKYLDSNFKKVDERRFTDQVVTRYDRRTTEN